MTFLPMKTRPSASADGGRWMAVNDSTRCETASAPALAVRLGGQEYVSSGSQIATDGIRYGEEMPALSSRRLSLRTQTGVTSEPVPPVVGTAMIGSTGLGTAFSP